MDKGLPPGLLPQLAELVSECTGLRIDEIHPEQRLAEDLELDSLAMHALLLCIDDRWHVMPDTAQIAAAVTLRDLAHAVADQLIFAP